MNDTDNWSFNNESFNIISNKDGPFSIDRFANNYVNAFTDDWSKDHNWLYSPISCIGSVLRHLTLCKARGALIVPIWPSSYYWPLIYPHGDKMADFVKQ